MRVLDKDYYLTRERYNYFLDATIEEIRDVVCYWDSYLQWQSLDIWFTFEALDNPEKCQRNRKMLVYVRGVPRPDLSTHLSKRIIMKVIRDHYNDDEELKKAYIHNLTKVQNAPSE